MLTRIFRPAYWKWISKIGTLAVSAALFLYAFRISSKKVIVLDLIAVPKELQDAGVTSEALTESVREKLLEVEQTTDPVYRDQFSTTLDGDLPDIELPKTHYSLKAVVGFLRYLRHTSPPHLGAEVTNLGQVNQFQIICRLLSSDGSAPLPPPPPRAVPKSLDSLVSEIASGYAELYNPYLLGSYLVQERDFARAEDLARRMLDERLGTDDIRARSYLLMAMAANGRGQLGNATVHVNRALEIGSNDWLVLNEAGVIYLGQGRTALAEQTLQKAYQLSPDSCIPVANLSIALSIDNKSEEAERLLLQNLKSGERCGSAAAALGETYVQKNRLQDAERQYSRALLIDPRNAEFHSLYGVLLIKEHLEDRAFEELRRAVFLRPGLSSAHGSLASLYTDRKDFAAARHEIELGLRTSPDSPVLHTNLGVTLAEQRLDEGAKAEFNKALTVDPNYSRAYDGLAYISQRDRRFDQATGYYRKALSLDVNDDEAESGLGLIAVEELRLDEASLHFERAYKIDPTSPKVHLGLGILATQHGDFSTADRELGKALKWSHDDFDVYDALGSLHLLQGQTQKATQDFQKAISINSEIAPPFMGLGEVAIKEGKYDEAIEEFRRAIALRPSNCILWVDLGIAQAKRGLLDEAISSFHKAIETQPADSGANFFLGIAEYKQGKVEAAIAHIKTAINSTPEQATGYCGLYWIYQATGDQARAAAQFRLAHLADAVHPCGNTLPF